LGVSSSLFGSPIRLIKEEDTPSENCH